MDSADEELEDAIDAAIGMLDRRRFDKELGILSVVRLEMRRNELGWAWVSEEKLAARAGMSRSTLRVRCGPDADKGQGRMWRTQWILERGPSHAGTRATAWRIRHPSRWRAVPWIEKNKELRDYRLGFVTWAENETADDAQPRDSKIARQTDLAARFKDRAASDENDPLAARFKDRAATRKTAARKGREIARLDEPFGDSSPSVVGAASAPPPGGAQKEEWDAAQLVIRAIEVRTGKEMYANSLKARTLRMLRRAPVDELLALVARVPDGYMPPATVTWLERVVGGEIHLLRGPSDSDPLTVELERLRGEVAAFERAGEELPEELTAALQACETQLRHREEPDT